MRDSNRIAVYREWQVKVCPTTYLLDVDGNIAYRAIGALEWDDDETLGIIESLLPGDPAAVSPLGRLVYPGSRTLRARTDHPCRARAADGHLLDWQTLGRDANVDRACATGSAGVPPALGGR